MATGGNILLTCDLDKGLDTGRDPKVTTKGLLKADNAIYPRAGTIEKRHGSVACTGGYDGGLLATHAGRPILYGTSVRLKDGSTAGGTFSEYDTSSLVDAWCEDLISYADKAVAWPDIASAGSVLAISFLETSTTSIVWNNRLRIISLDRESRRILSETVLANSTNGYGKCRLVSTGTKLYYFYYGDNGELYWGTIDATTGAIGSRNLLWTPGITGIVAQPYFDACYIGGSAKTIMVAVRCYDGGPPITHPLEIIAFATTTDTVTGTVTGSVGGSNTEQITVTPWYQTWGGSAYAQCAVLFVDENAGSYDIWMEIVTDSAVIRSITDIATSTAHYSFGRMAVVPLTATTGRIYWCGHDAAPAATGAEPEYTCALGFTWNPTTYAVALGSPWYPVRKASMDSIPIAPHDYSGAWDYPGHWYVAAMYAGDGHDDGPQIVMNGATSEPCAVLPGDLRGNASGFTSGGIASLNNLPGFVRYSATEFWTIKVRRKAIASYGVALVKMRVVDSARQTTNHKNLLLANSLPWEFDGRAFVEQGFVQSAARAPIATDHGPAVGAGLDAGDYGYAQVFEWLDSAGDLHQSAPVYLAAPVTIGAGRQARIAVWTLNVTQKANVWIALYRTLHNGIVYYRCTGIENDKTVDHLLIYDELPDSGMVSSDVLYTEGNVLAVDPTPPHRVCAMHQSRRFLAPIANEDREVRYSKEISDGYGLEHSDLLTIAVPPDGGVITAIGSLLDRLIVFKADRIYAWSGSGLSSTGSGSGYSGPYLISEAIGCTLGRSLVQLPAGLAFLSSQGIVLLDKTLSITALGDPVRYHTDTYQVTDAALVASQSIAVWSTHSGPMLVYNYLQGKWSTWTDHESVSLTVANGYLYYVSHVSSKWTQGSVRYHDHALYHDDAYAITMTIETPWYTYTAPAGRYRLRKAMLLGQALSANTLQTSVAYDDDPVWDPDRGTPQSIVLAAGDVADYSAHLGAGLSAAYKDKALLAEIGLSRSRVSAVRFRIRDSSQYGGEPSASFSLSAISLLLAPTDRMVPRGAARRSV